MSKQIEISLHILWTPHWVSVLNTITGKSAQGATLSDVSEAIDGHKTAIVGVGRSQVFLRSARLPRAAADDLRRILNVQLDNYFPLPGAQLSYDFLQTNDVTSEGCLTVIAAMRADDLRALRAALKQAGLTATRVVPLALAAPSVAARAGLTDAIVAEPEGTGLALDVVQQGIVRSSRVSLAASDPVGEVKRTAASAKAPDIMVIATGRVDVPGSKPGLDSALSLLNLTPPFNFELGEDRILAAKQRIGALHRTAALMLTAALVLAGAAWSDRYDALSAVDKQNGSVARQMTTTKSILAAELTKVSKLTAVNASLDRAYKPAQPLSDIAASVSDALPAGAWLTGATIERGKPLDIRGATKSADDVATFVDNLSASPRFRDVRLVFANSALIGKIPVVQFSVSATAIGNLPLATQERKLAARKAATSASSSTSSTSSTSMTGGTQ